MHSKPLIFGFVHTDSFAGHLSDLLVKQSGMDNLGKLIFKLFDEFIYYSDGFENYKILGKSFSLKAAMSVKKDQPRIFLYASACSLCLVFDGDLLSVLFPTGIL